MLSVACAAATYWQYLIIHCKVHKVRILTFNTKMKWELTGAFSLIRVLSKCLCCHKVLRTQPTEVQVFAEAVPRWSAARRSRRPRLKWAASGRSLGSAGTFQPRSTHLFPSAKWRAQERGTSASPPRGSCSDKDTTRNKHTKSDAVMLWNCEHMLSECERRALRDSRSWS